MFNRNGNNGNGAVHVNGAAKNGNGHKPDAAIVSEHELLWDGLSPAVTQALGQPIDPELVSQRKGRSGQDLRLPRRPRRHHPGQPHLRIRGMGLRAGRRRDPTPGRDRRFADRRSEGLARLQRPGAGHRGGRSAPHRHRRPPGHGGQLRRARHRDEGSGHGRHEACLPRIRRPVRKRLLRRPAAGHRSPAGVGSRAVPGEVQRQRQAVPGSPPPAAGPACGRRRRPGREAAEAPLRDNRRAGIR